LSSMVPGAKDKLKSFGAPIPQPDPNSLAWMTAEQNTPRPHTSLVKRPLSLISNGPKGEIQLAATHGAPNLQPESDSISPSDILKPGGQSGVGGGTGLIAVVTPGSNGTTGTSENVAPAAGEGATSDAAGTTPAASQPPADPAAAPASSTASDNPAKPAAAESTSETPAKPDAAAAGTETKSDAAAAGTETKSDATDAAKTGDAQNSGDTKKESSSKKKKGLRKIVPW